MLQTQLKMAHTILVHGLHLATEDKKHSSRVFLPTSVWFRGTFGLYNRMVERPKLKSYLHGSSRGCPLSLLEAAHNKLQKAVSTGEKLHTHTACILTSILLTMDALTMNALTMATITT